MADFNIQRGESVMTTLTTAVITAGVDYTAPAALSSAFIRIVGTNAKSDSNSTNDFQIAERADVSISNPGNLLTSITFTRIQNSGSHSLRIQWEIIEYIGDASGANEFVVLDEGVASYGTGDSTTDTGATAPTNDADVVVFITGAESNGGIRTEFDQNQWTSEWVAASNLGRFTRGATGRAGEVSFANVEFTGSNWTVARVEHTWGTGEDGTQQDETITAVVLARTFTHWQMRSDQDGESDGLSAQAWLSGTTTASWLMNSSADDPTSAQVSVGWIIENDQTDGTPAVAARYSGARTGTTDGDPDQWTETVTAVDALATTSIWGESAATDESDGADGGHYYTGFRLTSTTGVLLSRGRDSFRRDWRFETYEWPTVAAVGGRIMSSLAAGGGLAGPGGIAGAGGGLAA